MVVVVVGGDVVVVVVAGGDVVGVVVVGGGEVAGVVVFGGDVVGVVDVPLLGEVPVVDEGVEVVVTPGEAGAELGTGFAITTTDHLPHVSVTFPLT